MSAGDTWAVTSFSMESIIYDLNTIFKYEMHVDAACSEPTML